MRARHLTGEHRHHQGLLTVWSYTIPLGTWIWNSLCLERLPRISVTMKAVTGTLRVSWFMPIPSIFSTVGVVVQVGLCLYRKATQLVKAAKTRLPESCTLLALTWRRQELITVTSHPITVGCWIIVWMNGLVLLILIVLHINVHLLIAIAIAILGSCARTVFAGLLLATTSHGTSPLTDGSCSSHSIGQGVNCRLPFEFDPLNVPEDLREEQDAIDAVSVGPSYTGSDSQQAITRQSSRGIMLGLPERLRLHAEHAQHLADNALNSVRDHQFSSPTICSSSTVCAEKGRAGSDGNTFPRWYGLWVACWVWPSIG